jgi:hypothetical protein
MEWGFGFSDTRLCKTGLHMAATNWELLSRIFYIRGVTGATG